MNLIQKLRTRVANAILPISTRRFEAAGGGRRFGGRAPFGSYRAETSAANPLLRTRARHLCENSPYAANGLNVWASNLIGCGIMCAPKHENPDTRKALSAAHTKWADNCDMDGRTDWAGLQTQIALGVIRDGESFVHLMNTQNGFKIRLVPPEQIGNTVGGNNTYVESVTGGVINGIKFAADGTREAYMVRPDPLRSDVITVDAKDMLHIFVPHSPGQIRGISWLAPVMLTLGDYDELSDALLMAAKVAAMHAGFITDMSGNNALPYTGDQVAAQMEVSLEPGTMKVLGPGQDVRFSSPQQLPSAIQLGSQILQAIAAGLGLPDWMLSGDVSKVNYSTARAAMIQYRTRVEAIQFHTFLPQLIRPVYERVITTAILSGELDLQIDEALAFQMYPPKMAHLDPSKESEGEKIAVDSGFKSRRQVVAELGYSIEDVDSEIAADRAREKLLGLSFIAQPNTNGSTQNVNPQQSN